MPVAESASSPPVRRLVIFLGMTASGKSTLAQAWAERQGVPYYNTDRVRKELVGLQATDRRPDGIGQGIYSPALTAQTYQEMLGRAQRDFTAGATMVVLDGSYSLRADRDAVRELAREADVRPCFFYCYCSQEVTRQRLSLRAADSNAVSDGRWEIYLYQQQSFALPDATTEPDCLALNTEAAVEELLKQLAAQPCLQD